MRKYRKVRVLKYRKVLKQFCANFKWAKSRISGPEIVPPVLGQIRTIWHLCTSHSIREKLSYVWLLHDRLLREGVTTAEGFGY